MGAWCKSNRVNGLMAWCSQGILLLCMVSCSSIRYDNTEDRAADSLQSSAQLLRISPDPIDLGALSPGKRVETEIALMNVQEHSVQLASIRTSCPCIRISGSPLQVAPRDSATLALVFDPTEDPDFRGSLSVEVTGLGADGDVVFRTVVKLTVKSDVPPG
jgi:Protein of unknown function (DUF1573)